jgi:hypothetical protein
MDGKTTPEQYAGIRKLLKSARCCTEKAENLEREALRSISQILETPIDKVPTNAPNARNLEEAVTCYISYGEYDIINLMNEIKKAK